MREDQGRRDGSDARRSMTVTSLRTARRCMIPLTFMDARRGMIHDGNGGPVGQRPGFLVRDNEADEQARRGCLSAVRRRRSASVGVSGPGQRSSPARSEPPQTFANPEAAVAAAYAEYNRDIQERWRQMTDYQSLPPSVLAKIEDPSVNTVAITQIDLDARIAAAFADGAKSNDVAILIKDTEHGAASASDQAEQARNHALDPTLSGSELKDARKCMDDAAFRRDRLQAALGKLRERLAQLKDQEENARRQVAYDKAKAVRDELAKELADLYPAFAQKLVELLARVVINDREIDRINNALPRGADRLLVAELKARGLPWVVNNVETPRITDQLCLPPWQPRSNYLWPPRK